MVQDALQSLQALLPQTLTSAQLAVLDDEAVVPRLLHVLTSSSGGPAATKPTPDSVAAACQVLLCILREDGAWQLLDTPPRLHAAPGVSDVSDVSGVLGW